jgi:hypothetical protein
MLWLSSVVAKILTKLGFSGPQKPKVFQVSYPTCLKLLIILHLKIFLYPFILLETCKKTGTH